ncbi:FAD dependent oxidoreductase [Pholiota conissans]|uniref:FAD dependent oxidoreductase n=1 Tax=Pholiota conissans TaxID=109636 RepID=A0A9P5ZE13_9AGAR|nr:FAD dependent oxidoreductase [Pholiota conissans]
MILPKDESILIVGAGCFGVSTAYHLLQRGYTDVTIIDRSPVIPAPDAASNDINRIVRSSYSDKFYAKLARDAILSWKDKKWGGSYHESGVVVLGSSSSGETYADGAYENDLSLGAAVKPLNDSDAVRSAFPAQVPTAAFDGFSGYLNRDGGWANAGLGLTSLINEVKALNGKFIPGKQIDKIIREGGRTTGVHCSDGAVFNASLVIIATGSWTPSAFSELDLGHICLATGQCVAMVQLSEEEAKVYKDCPVVVDFGASGFYVFPPNEQNIVKFAIHAPGYTHFGEANPTISTPRTVTSDPVRGLHIPKVALQELRSNLKRVYPDLAEKSFIGMRLCWYNDSPDGDWVVSRYPKDESLILATADSGHAYKFLPVIGGLIADLVEDKLAPELVAKFAIDRKISQVDTSRSGQVRTLELDGLCTLEDLKYPPAP